MIGNDSLLLNCVHLPLTWMCYNLSSLAYRSTQGKCSRTVSKRNAFWGKNQGKSVVISDVTTFPSSSLYQEQISASQADKASISEYMWWLELRFLVTTVGLYQIPISEHLRLEMTRRRIILHSESRNLLFLFIGFLIFQSIFLCPSGLMFSQIPALSPGEGMTEFRELVFWMGLWLSIWNFYRRNGSNRGLTGEAALNVYMDTYVFVFFDTLEPM